MYIYVCRQLQPNKHHLWCKNVEVTEQILHSDDTMMEHASQLSSLNLAHNLFTSIPVPLPCLAVNLTRLNMAFNSLRSMSHITSYPNSLKQLDLSHNLISCWPSLPQVEAQDSMEMANIACYCQTENSKGKLPIITAGKHMQGIYTSKLLTFSYFRAYIIISYKDFVVYLFGNVF